METTDFYPFHDNACPLRFDRIQCRTHLQLPSLCWQGGKFQVQLVSLTLLTSIGKKHYLNVDWGIMFNSKQNPMNFNSSQIYIFLSSDMTQQISTQTLVHLVWTSRALSGTQSELCTTWPPLACSYLSQSSTLQYSSSGRCRI